MQNPIALAKKVIKKGYDVAMRSIAFYPVFISFTLFCFAFFTLSFEDFDLVSNMKGDYPYLFIDDTDTARTILSTLIAGILSLTVFSFTMVMVVLNQASSNFSPRLLPGLVSNKRHQLILGCYIGTLLYCTIVLISLGAYELEDSTVGLSTTIAAIFGVCCVGLFVSFIHNISSAVQIQNIVEGIYKRTDTKLDGLLDRELRRKTPLQHLRTDDFTVIASEESGYFQGFDIDLVDSKLFDADLQLIVIPYSSQHILKDSPLLKTSRKLTKEEEGALCFACTVSKDLHDGHHPLLGLIKLMEVAVRAMSPGINDPGTALDVVHKLGPLLHKMVRLPTYTSINANQKGIVVTTTNISTSELLSTILQPIRLYAKNNTTLMIGLIRILDYLNAMGSIYNADKKAIAKEREAIRSDVDSCITNKKDKEEILRFLGA
ncbi:DUF2254 domain-containing protein [Costertonia aggregata]|uniref:DUF2254 domain-containing protein n=1 Tax=Costertonia aggregata TaxID=343403 RepID=A0A7H9ANI8_9FLAO|nr:DUF2254 domain-containing protein [Costertonia aggregata]QLG44964.1 DUF2254 domain-containing protein [Costertonia aggregata]